MIPAARIQATIELLGEIFSRTVPADNIITGYFRQRRYIGSSDRREISRCVYGVLRQYFALQWLVGDQPTPRLMLFTYLLKFESKNPDTLGLGDRYGPDPLSPMEAHKLQRLAEMPAPPMEVKLNIPPWALPHLQKAFPKTWTDESGAMNREATFDIRVNTLKCTRDEALLQLTHDKIQAEPTPYSPFGLRLAQRRPLPTHPLWQEGCIEVQDEGSQLLGLIVDAQPTETILDLCAGAGGKTLLLAMSMENKGKIYATDVVKYRLDRARERLNRADVHNVELKLLDSKGLKWLNRQQDRFDKILIDAPCSGSGTWRRNPDLKFRFSETDLEEVMAKQAALLEQAVPYLKPGGTIFYATCSLFQAENENQIEALLKKCPHVHVEPLKTPWLKQQDESPFFRVTPFQHGCDGFFIAALKKT